MRVRPQQVRGLSSLSFILIVGIPTGKSIEELQASASVDGDGSVNLEFVPRNSRQELQTDSSQVFREGEKRSVEIDAHGRIFHPERHTDVIRVETPTSSEASHEVAAILEQRAKTREKPMLGARIEGYESSDCSGAFMGAYELPSADITGNKCQPIRDLSTDRTTGRMKVSCDNQGTAKVCIWHQPSDLECQLSEPFCLMIQPVDAPYAALGQCTPATEFPGEGQTFVRFAGFPPGTVWPECLTPPIDATTMFASIFGGVVAGMIVLAITWTCFLALPTRTKNFPRPHGSPHEPPQEPHHYGY